MKIQTTYALNYSFNLDNWLEEYKPIMTPKESDSVRYSAYEMYLEKCAEFKSLLKSTDDVTDQSGKKLTPLQIYNAIEDYKIIIKKLILIINLRLYKAYNVKK